MAPSLPGRTPRGPRLTSRITVHVCYPAAGGPFVVPASETWPPGTPAIGENSLSGRHRHTRDRVSYFGYRFAAQEFDAQNPAEVAVTQDRVRPAGYIRAPR